jgi:gliding motility-associated-like protein
MRILKENNKIKKVIFLYLNNTNKPTSVLLKDWSFKNNTYFKRKAPTLLSWCFLLSCYSLRAQINLVQNPGFENISSCPTFYNQIKLATGWDTLIAGGGGGPDVFNSCANPSNFYGVPNNLYGISYQIPKTGVSYSNMGFFVNSTVFLQRDYMQTKLIHPLVVGKTYCVKFYASLTNRSKYAIDELGAYFDYGSIYAPYYAPAIVNPQVKSATGIFYSDTLNWMKVEGLYTATNPYDYLTLGNFRTQAATNYTLAYPSNSGILAEYYIDDVSVIEVNTKAYAGRDTLICANDSVFIGRQLEIGLECQWFNNTIQIADGASIWVKPNVNQQYIIKQDVCGIISYDTVQVIIKDINCNLILNSEIPNSFTPNADGINDVWQFTLGSGITLNGFDIYNRWGNLIKNLELSTSNIINWDGRTTSGEPCSDGVYFYVLNYTDIKGVQQNKKGYISLFK